MAETVELMQEQVQDDAVLTDSATPLSELMEAETTPAEPVQTEEPKEAGWIKTRIQKGIDKALPDIEARIRAEYEAKYAPLMEAHLNQEADKLVASGKISDREMALEYLKLSGSKPVEKQAPQPRDEQGRFAPRENPGEQKARELFLQAQTIKESTGVDVMNLYHNDPDVQARVNSGEWNFSDVYKSTLQPKAPPVVRSGSGGSIGATSISKMSSSAFREFNERLAKGERFDARR